MFLFGEYYVAEDYEEEQEIIETFAEEDYSNLVIIDPYLFIERYKEMCTHSCSVQWLTESSVPDAAKKQIYLHDKFDTLAANFIQTYSGKLVFFNLQESCK